MAAADLLPMTASLADWKRLGRERTVALQVDGTIDGATRRKSDRRRVALMALGAFGLAMIRRARDWGRPALIRTKKAR